MPRKAEALTLPEAPDFTWENKLWQKGVCRVAGLDEAGRGALAGPVSAGAVIFPRDASLQASLTGLRDSKQLSAREREAWAERIQALALAWGTGLASHEEIDALGILPATRLAMQRALSALKIEPEHLLIDFIRLPQVPLPQEALVKADERCLSVAAAAVLAKTTRDAWMVACEAQFPGYGFAAHKGYGTLAHRQALKSRGLCPLHRRTFHSKEPE